MPAYLLRGSLLNYLNQENVFPVRKIGGPDGDPEGGSIRGSRLRVSCFVPNPSGTIDLPENQLDAVTTELWKTSGWQGHILGSYKCI